MDRGPGAKLNTLSEKYIFERSARCCNMARTGIVCVMWRYTCRYTTRMCTQRKMFIFVLFWQMPDRMYLAACELVIWPAYFFLVSHGAPISFVGTLAVRNITHTVYSNETASTMLILRAPPALDANTLTQRDCKAAANQLILKALASSVRWFRGGRFDGPFIPARAWQVIAWINWGPRFEVSRVLGSPNLLRRLMN